MSDRIKILIVAKKDRYEKFLPDNAFTASTERYYAPAGTPLKDIPEEALQAEYLVADAVAPVSAELIGAMPNLKIIHSEGVGFNGIDLAAATARGIYVCNCKGVNDVAVAEQALLLMLGLLRDAIPSHRAVLEGRQMQTKERKMFEGITELGECSVGLIGFGDVAKATALLLKPFGCEVFYTDIARLPAEIEEKYNAHYLTLDEILATCRIVSLHVPVTKATASMVNDEFFSKMRPDALLINTARGEIVDNDALIRALTSGAIAGAGIDTLAPEPVTADNPVLALPPEVMDKVFFSPHLGGITTATFKRAHRRFWKAFEDVSEGKRPANIVNGL